MKRKLPCGIEVDEIEEKHKVKKREDVE